LKPILILIFVANLCLTSQATVAQEVAPVVPDTLVLCPAQLQPGLTDWLEYRQQQGYRIQVVSPAPIAAGIKQQIRSAARRTITAGHKLSTVVLVGDVVDLRFNPQQQLATDYVRARVNVCFGSDANIATDSPYADLDDDGLPDVAIGRIPVDSLQQLREFSRRVIEYESQSASDLASAMWRRRINFVAGVGSFGKIVDAVVEQTTKQIITDLVPASYATTMTYGSWSSPYCPDPRRFAATAIDRFNEGALFWVYVGHGNRRQLDHVRFPDQAHPILNVDTAKFLSAKQGSPVAIFLACFTGAMDDAYDGLAETMLQQPRGPIAVVAGTRVTMPYAMSLLSLEMMDEYFEGDSRTLGQLMLVAKRRMVAAKLGDDKYRNLIESMGRSLSPLPNLLAAERREHVQLVHLLGDPLLKLLRPKPLKLHASPSVDAGQTLKVSGESPAAGQLQIDLVYERDRFLQRPPRRRQYEASNAAFNEYQKIYEAANHRTVWFKRFTVQPGGFRVDLPVPPTARGRCQVRAVMTAGQEFAMGSCPVRVNKIESARQTASVNAGSSSQ
jgi:hypothetical protein